MALSIGRPLLLVSLLLGLAIVSVQGVFRIDYESGLRSLFSSKSSEFKNYIAHSRKFALNETDIAVLVTAEEGLNGQTLEQLQDFVLEVQFIKGIEAVLSVFSLRQRSTSGDTLVPLLPHDLADEQAVGQALLGAKEKSITGVSMVSQDMRETVLVLSINNKISGFGGASQFLRRLQVLIDQTSAQSGLSFGVTGLLPLRENILSGLRFDQTRINGLGAVLGFAVSLMMFRSFWVAALNTVTPLAALLFCLGAFGWLGLPINALTNALPVLILVLASSDSIHITYEIRRRMGAGEDRLSAIKNAVVDIAPPCVLTSLTTMLAFSSLFYSGSPIIRDLASAGAAGVFIALLTVLFVHPLVFVLGTRLGFIARALPEAQSERGHRRLGQMFSRLSGRFRLVSLAGLAVCLISLWVLTPVKTSYRFLENIDSDQEVALTLAKVEAVAGPITSINVPLHVNEGYTFSDDAVIGELLQLAKKLEQIDKVTATVSIANLLELAGGRGEALTDRLLSTLEQIPGRFRHLILSKDKQRLQIMLLVPDEGSEAVSKLVDEIRATLTATPLKTLSSAAPTGFLVMSSALSDTMIRQLTISFLIAALACPALIGLWYRRLDFGLAATVPNILPIALVGAGLTLTGYNIQFTSALALTIAFGIALDDSIHVFNRLSLQNRRQKTPLSAGLVAESMNHISPVLITTTLILSSGLLATQVSDMPMIRFFGILCITTFFLALFCDLILLPAMVTWIGQKRKA